VVCTRTLELVNLVYSRKTVSSCGECCPDFDGIGLLGDKLRDATGEGGQLVRVVMDDGDVASLTVLSAV
jgi:hypothetical protein